MPRDWLKTKFYLNFVKLPRTIIRQLFTSFYRIDHIYDVIREFKNKYEGDFSILEFGVADGYAFVKKLYAVKFLGMEHRIITHGFDSFEGMPETDDDSDKDIVADDGWVTGQFSADYDDLYQYCQNKYHQFKLHKGYFEDTLTEDFLRTLEKDLPILVWIDCDYYSSSKIVMERIIFLSANWMRGVF